MIPVLVDWMVNKDRKVSKDNQDFVALMVLSDLTARLDLQEKQELSVNKVNKLMNSGEAVIFFAKDSNTNGLL